MNRFRKYIVMLVLVIVAGFAGSLTTNAQPGDPGCDPLDPACPIDGGVSLLIAAGISIGAKKAYDKRKKDQNIM